MNATLIGDESYLKVSRPCGEIALLASRRTDEGDLLEEVAFNCRGGVVSMKQVMSDETPYSRFHSYDITQAMRNPSFMGGPQATDIAPDTAYDKAQKLICK